MEIVEYASKSKTFKSCIGKGGSYGIVFYNSRGTALKIYIENVYSYCHFEIDYINVLQNGCQIMKLQNTLLLEFISMKTIYATLHRLCYNVIPIKSFFCLKPPLNASEKFTFHPKSSILHPESFECMRYAISMPKYEGTISDVLKLTDKRLMRINLMFCVISVLGFIKHLQKLKINHNDIKENNIFLEDIKKIKRLRNSTSICIKISNELQFRFKTSDILYIPKIGDWGLCAFYSDDIRIENSSNVHQNETTGAYAYFHEMYDVVFFLMQLSYYNYALLKTIPEMHAIIKCLNTDVHHHYAVHLENIYKIKKNFFDFTKLNSIDVVLNSFETRDFFDADIDVSRCVTLDYSRTPRKLKVYKFVQLETFDNTPITNGVINERMYNILTSWLIEIITKWKIANQKQFCFQLCCTIRKWLKDFSENNNPTFQITTKNFQLLGICAFYASMCLTTSECTESEIRHLIYVTDRAFTRDEFLSFMHHTRDNCRNYFIYSLNIDVLLNAIPNIVASESQIEYFKIM